MLEISKRQQAKLKEVLIRVRKAAGLTQDQLTEKLGAADSFINKIENGNRQLGFFEFYTILEATGHGHEAAKLAREIWEERP